MVVVKQGGNVRKVSMVNITRLSRMNEEENGEEKREVEVWV